MELEVLLKSLAEQKSSVDKDGKGEKLALVTDHHHHDEDEIIEIAKEMNMKPKGFTEEQLKEKGYSDDDLEKAIGELDASRIITIKGSDETVDRDGDIIRVDGWDLKDFKKNPVFLAHHDARSLPVGRVVRVWKANNVPDSPGGKALMFKVYFPEAEVSQDADTFYKLFKNKMLNAVSVGFRILSGSRPETQSDRDALGLGQWGIEVKEAKLHELSAVTIPANQNALVVRSAEEEELCKKAGIKYELEKSDDHPQEDDEFVAVPKKFLDLILGKLEKVENFVDNVSEKNLIIEEHNNEHHSNDESSVSTKDSSVDENDEHLDDDELTALQSVLKGFQKQEDPDHHVEDEDVESLLLKSFNKKEGI